MTVKALNSQARLCISWRILTISWTSSPANLFYIKERRARAQIHYIMTYLFNNVWPDAIRTEQCYQFWNLPNCSMLYLLRWKPEHGIRTTFGSRESSGLETEKKNTPWLNTGTNAYVHIYLSSLAQYRCGISQLTKNALQCIVALMVFTK
jgi:hypothetical protein